MKNIYRTLTAIVKKCRQYKTVTFMNSLSVDIGNRTVQRQNNDDDVGVMYTISDQTTEHVNTVINVGAAYQVQASTRENGCVNQIYLTALCGA